MFKKYLPNLNLKIVFICLIISLGLIKLTEEIYLDYVDENWSSHLDNMMEDYQEVITLEFNNEFEHFSKDFREFKSALLNSKNIKVEIPEEISDYSFSILNSDYELTNWNEYSFSQNSYKMLIDNYRAQELFFKSNGLKTYLLKYEEIKIDEESFFIFFQKEFEKHYKLNNSYYEDVSFNEKLSERLYLNIEIDYTSKDVDQFFEGSEYGFPVFNLENEQIAFVKITKPLKSISILKNEQIFGNIIKVLVFVLFVMLFPILFKYFKKFGSIAEFSFLIIFLVVLRILFYYLSIQIFLFPDVLINSSFFSSKFGYGIVSSPIDLFLSVLVFFIITSLLLVRISKKQFEFKSITKSVLIGLVLLILLIYFPILRGFGASVKSVIYDSTLSYFKDYTILPDFVTSVIHLSILLLCTSIILFLSSLISILYRALRIENNTFTKVISVIVLALTGYIYFLLQEHPQVSMISKLVFIITTVFTASYLAKNRDLKIGLYIPIIFLSSIISINLLIQINREYEKESLETLSKELTRSDYDWLSFLMVESESQILENNDKKLILEQCINHDALAFSIWSNSILQKEAVVSKIIIVDENLKRLGQFAYDWNEPIDDEKISKAVNSSEVINFINPKSKNEIHIKSVDVFKNDKIIGYLLICVKYDEKRVNYSDYLSFLKSEKSNLDKKLQQRAINIFVINDKKTDFTFSDYSLSEFHIDKINNIKFDEEGEGWTEFNLSGDKFTVLIKKLNDDGSRKLALVSKNRDITILLFDFFKIFFVHTIYILITIIFIFTYYKFGLKKPLLTFQTRLQLIFLIISIIPLIILAVYFKSLSEEKNSSAIYYKLRKRAVSIENYCKDRITDYENIDRLFENTSEDLGINFSVYENDKLVFSSTEQVYSAVLLPPRLKIGLANKDQIGYTEFIVEENIEKFNFNSFYYNFSLDGNQLTLNVNDGFNRITLPMSDTQMDISIFGTYSLAVLIIIIISTIMSKQISQPIRSLTLATKHISEGDFTVKIRRNRKGEIGALIDGFNLMVDRLEENRKKIAKMERETAWKEMARQVAHEIKNPLTPMKLSIQQLKIAYSDKSERFPEILSKVTNTVIKQIDLLRNIATEFSNFAKMPELKLERIDIIPVIHEAVSLYMHNGVEINFNSKLNEAIILGDKEHLKRLLINFVKNSIQAKATKINIDLAIEQNNYNLIISDNGLGISEKIKNKIFEANFTTKLEGMGLGLNMALRFIEKIDGSIDIPEHEGKGAIFIIKIPMLKND